MKKITALFLTFALLFSFAACQKEEVQEVLTTLTSASASVTSSEASSTHSETEATEKTTVSQTNTTSKTQKITLAATVKTTVTEILTTVKTTAEKKTIALTTRRNYFPSKASTTKKETTSETTETTTRRRKTTTTETAASVDTRYPGGPTVIKTEAKNTCTISINCTEILENKDDLKNGKEMFLPSSGYILKTVTVEFESGETVFDVLKRVCKDFTCSDNCQYCQSSGIQLEYEFTPGYDNYYIEGIHQIYEKDCGSKSGWMYKVNGVFPNYGCSDYKVKSGDKVEFVYTCNLGEDVGAEV